ncbi:MAG: ribonuclease HII [Angelakisella sp.]
MMSFEELLAFDCDCPEYPAVCGLDEAGRGPLAGPVFAACALLKPGAVIPGLNDSKKLSEKRREQIFEQLLTGELAWYGVGAATPAEIDQRNILQATFLAMRRAYAALLATVDTPPALALVDGNLDPKLPVAVRTVVKGDGKSAAIAAASVLAKVSRDHYMLQLHQSYPQYGFDRHKGYPTAGHYAAIAQYGISPVHRLSFLKKLTGER